MNSILLSIHPKWCELIASGKKTIEVRKTKPKLDTPFKCYIYQTKKPVSVSFSGTGRHISEYDKTEYYNKQSGKVIGEFVCDMIDEYTVEFVDDCHENIRWHFIDINGKQREVTIWNNSESSDENCFLFRHSRLSHEELKRYVGLNFYDKPFYGWHISDLIIYNDPKSLTMFHRECNSYFNGDYSKCDCCEWGGDTPENGYECGCCCEKPLTRPPKSWCYVESLSQPPHNGHKFY